MASSAQLAKLFLVKTLLAVALLYGLSLPVNRDSPDNAVTKAYSKLLARAQLGRGGSAEPTRCASL